MPVPAGLPAGAVSTKQAILNLSYVENNIEVSEAQVILVAVDRTATQLRVGGTVVPVQSPARGAPYALAPINALRQANLVCLMASGVDLVQLMGRGLRTHTVGPLPWNQVYSILAATTVDFYHPSSTIAVNALHQLVSSDECKWEQGSWSTVAEMSLMTGFCMIEHPRLGYLNPSHYDLKIGALNVLRLVESVLDASELNDDLINYGDMILVIHNIERRLFQIFKIAKSQGVKIALDAAVRSGTTVCPHYRWLPPHCYRLKDTHAGDLGIGSFKMDRRLGVWSSGKLCSPLPEIPRKGVSIP